MDQDWNLWALAAGALTAFTLAVHVVLGGRDTARPLLDTDGLTEVAKATAYFCWHLVTLTLAGMAAAFVWHGVAGAPSALVLVTVLAGFFAALSLGLSMKFGRNVLLLPAWTLFAPVAMFGALAIFA